MLKKDLELVKKGIDDCRSLLSEEEWNQQCQLLLKANSGMNLEEFYNYLGLIARHRMQLMPKKAKVDTLLHLYSLSKIQLVLSELLQDKHIQLLLRKQQIDNTLEENILVFLSDLHQT